jgi:hypothetical protein
MDSIAPALAGTHAAELAALNWCSLTGSKQPKTCTSTYSYPSWGSGSILPVRQQQPACMHHQACEHLEPVVPVPSGTPVRIIKAQAALLSSSMSPPPELKTSNVCQHCIEFPVWVYPGPRTQQVISCDPVLGAWHLTHLLPRHQADSHVAHRCCSGLQYCQYCQGPAACAGADWLRSRL